MAFQCTVTSPEGTAGVRGHGYATDIKAVVRARTDPPDTGGTEMPITHACLP